MRVVRSAALDVRILAALNEDDSSYTAIAKQHDVSRQTVTRIAKQSGVYRTREERVTAAWDRRLESLESWFRAYLLGLVATDGSVGARRVVVTVSEADGAFLKAVASHLGVPSSVHQSGVSKRTGKKLYARSFNFGCRTICDRLRALGLQPDKTYSLDDRVVCAVPDQEFADFVCGVFDGDGSITSTHHPASLLIYSASKRVLVALADRLAERTGVTTPDPKKYTIWQIRWSNKRDLRLLYDYLYADPTRLCLTRKRDRIAGHLERLETFDRELAQIEQILREDLTTEPSYYAIDRKHNWHLGRARKYALRLGLVG